MVASRNQHSIYQVAQPAAVLLYLCVDCGLLVVLVALGISHKFGLLSLCCFHACNQFSLITSADILGFYPPIDTLFAV